MIIDGYGIKVITKDGREWLAHTSCSVPHVDRVRRRAVAHKKKLKEHMPDCKLKVIPVRVTIEEIPAPPAAG